jgi:hypothetical protein
VNQALVDYLVQSRKFTVLDREYQHETNNEKSIAIGGQSPVEELARMGQVLLADLVFVGSLDDFSYKTTTQKMHLSDRVITRGAGIATMGYRLVDVATQQIMASDSISIQITDADLQKEGNSSGSLIKKVLADKLALTISSKLLDVIFPLTIISVDGREVILSQGGKGVSSGQIYKIYKYGDKLYDPYTKEYIGRKESFCCQVEITRVTPKQAYGLIVEDSIDLAEGFTPKTYILREASEPKKQSVDHASKIKAIKNSHKKPSNDDW